MVVQFIVFLTLSSLIRRGTDISKCLSESLGFEITRVYCIFIHIQVNGQYPENMNYVLLIRLSKNTYSRLSLSRTPRDSMKHFEISVLRHIRFAELSKTVNLTTTFNRMNM